VSVVLPDSQAKFDTGDVPGRTRITVLHLRTSNERCTVFALAAEDGGSKKGKKDKKQKESSRGGRGGRGGFRGRGGRGRGRGRESSLFCLWPCCLLRAFALLLVAWSCV
jgi:hypothetical protein